MPEFDWVKELSACSSAKVFEQMRLEVEHDIETRNAELPPDANYKFTIVPKSEKFVVAVVSAKPGKHVPLRSVTFSLEDAGISVQGNDGKLKFEGTLTLNDDGECRLRVKGREREFWQFRRMALERLLFDTV